MEAAKLDELVRGLSERAVRQPEYKIVLDFVLSLRERLGNDAPMVDYCAHLQVLANAALEAKCALW